MSKTEKKMHELEERISELEFRLALCEPLLPLSDWSATAGPLWEDVTDAGNAYVDWCPRTAGDTWGEH